MQLLVRSSYGYKKNSKNINAFIHCNIQNLPRVVRKKSTIYPLCPHQRTTYHITKASSSQRRRSTYPWIIKKTYKAYSTKSTSVDFVLLNTLFKRAFTKFWRHFFYWQVKKRSLKIKEHFLTTKDDTLKILLINGVNLNMLGTR